MHVCILLTLVGSNLVAQDSHTPVNRGSVSAAKPRGGFLDFALKGVNPSDRDYGRCLDEASKFIFEETLTRGYFWSNVAALGLLGVFFVVIVHQQKVQQRRELIASELLAQYHNALARAEAQATEATKRNHDFMETMLAVPEANSMGEETETPAPKEAPSKERKRHPSSGTTGVATVVAPSVAAARGDFPRLTIAPSAVAKHPPSGALRNSQAPDQVQATGIGVDLTAKINSLQQQLDAYKEEKKELLRQVSFAELRLQKEQQKNRSLKGE
jgi:hypothetical protein